MNINEVAHSVVQSAISHKEGYNEKSDTNAAEAATEQMNPLLNYRSEGNGKDDAALLTTETCTH
jgi:hypothetical protein